MTRILTIFLLLIYSGSAFGIMVNYHYCGDHLTNRTIRNFGDRGSCKCNPAEMPSGCCKDKLICIKGDKHETTQFASALLPGNFIAIEAPALFNAEVTGRAFVPVRPIACGVVKKVQLCSLFLLNNVFRI